MFTWIQVEKGQPHLEKEYPCMAAVNRAASVIERHDGRLIWLTYKPEGRCLNSNFKPTNGLEAVRERVQQFFVGWRVQGVQGGASLLGIRL